MHNLGFMNYDHIINLSPEAVNPLLTVIKLHSRALRQIQGSYWLYKLRRQFSVR